jgi:hypothetical protein
MKTQNVAYKERKKGSVYHLFGGTFSQQSSKLPGRTQKNSSTQKQQKMDCSSPSCQLFCLFFKQNTLLAMANNTHLI